MHTAHNIGQAVNTTTQQRYFLWHGMTFAASDILTFISIVVLAYAAIQAFKTRKATAQAAILTVLPILFVEFETTNNSGSEGTSMQLKNVGTGPAFNVRIDDVTMDFLDINDRWRLKLSLKPDHLEANQSRLLERRVFDKSGDEANVTQFMTYMIQHRKNKPVKLTLYFRDVTGKRYVTVVETGKGLARIRKPSAQYGLRLMCKYRLAYPILNVVSTLVNIIHRKYEMKFRPALATKLNAIKKKK